MKKIIIFTLAIILVLPILTFAGQVRGYRSDRDHDGYKESYTRPYQRTNPDRYESNNYSYPGNLNPNTGKITGGNTDTYGTHHRRGSLWDK